MYHQVQNDLSFYGNNTIDGSIILKRRYLPEIKSFSITIILGKCAPYSTPSVAVCFGKLPVSELFSDLLDV
jgi:hypothetical protein